LDFCPELSDHQKHLVEILTDTVTKSQNNSVLLMGSRGSGKTTVLDSALNELTLRFGPKKVLVVKLSGVLHSDEKVGMREIAEQLCAASEELEFSRAAGFTENVAFMREVLRALERGGRAVIFVLEEFDLFAKGGCKNKQTLLYAVMDLLQQNSVQAAVVGVTARHAAAEMLEKRVRSRFSFRRILLAPPASDVSAARLLLNALRLPETFARADADANAALETHPFVLGAGTAPEPTFVSAAARVSYWKRFNAALDVAVAAPAAESALRSFEALECTPRSVADLALVVLSHMDRESGMITARDVALGVQVLLADTYVRSLAGSSVLELCLVVAMSRLHRFRKMPRFNFNHLENELRSMAANDFLGDAGRARSPVLLRAFEGLLAMGMCEARGNGGGGGSLGSGVGWGGAGGRVRGAVSANKHFRGISLLVTDEEVEVAVETHPTKPAGLKELLTHEGVRAATGF
jgi:origin recognition complex subunit 4